MATSVLGKRTRSSAVNDSSKAVPVSKRVKRQDQTEIFNDENENPFVGDFSHDTKDNGESMDIDESPESIFKSVPAKHGAVSKRVVQNPTPQTPRHRDALSKNGTITPRHRVIIAGKPLTPRTPRTPVTPGSSISTVYSLARQLFIRSSEPGKLIGREAEREELTSFIETGVKKAAGGCIYVSGPPGTGKSAMVNEVTESFEAAAILRKEYINCMSMKTSKDLYGKLLETFCEGDAVMEGEELKALQSIFVPRKKTQTVFVVTLDEIDHVLSLDLEILYKLFEWSLQKSSRLVLIGIANALDLTDRFLPRLKARNLKPQLLPFLPYSATQIKAVITTRLKSLVASDSPTPDYVPFLHPAAIELCSRKVSSQTGDLRKAFDICRRAIDLIETETKQKHEATIREQMLQDSPSKGPLEENSNLASPTMIFSPRKTANKSLSESLSTLTVETAPRALISHVNKITSATFGNGANQRLKALNLQQKAALCALVALEKKKREAMANVMATPSKSKTAAPTIKTLYAVYCMLCTRDSILHPLTNTEFRDVVGSLETLSLVNPVDGRNGSFIAMNTPSKRGRKFGSGIGVGDEKRVGSCVGEKEVAQAVEGLGAGILKSILSGEGLNNMSY